MTSWPSEIRILATLSIGLRWPITGVETRTAFTRFLRLVALFDKERNALVLTERLLCPGNYRTQRNYDSRNRPVWLSTPTISRPNEDAKNRCRLQTERARRRSGSTTTSSLLVTHYSKGP